jgi:crossover junction endodeoxyribonuclease RuvC
MPMPVAETAKGREIDENRIVDLLAEFRPERVYVEKVHAMPKQGVCSMFTFGTGWGIIRGILAGRRIPYILVTPQQWQKVVLAGQTRGSEYLVASRLWPTHDFRASPRCKVAHSGMVDAALLAEYGRRDQP